MSRRHQKRFPFIQNTSASLVGMCLRCVRAFFLIFHSPIAVAWILTVGSLITLTAISVPSLRATRIAATDLVVTFDDPPVWLDSSLLTELKDIVRSHLAAIPVGRNGLINASTALEGTGWFTNVEQVAWVDASHATVTATFLIPHARVRTTKGQRFIDPMGIVLPSRDGRIVSSGYYFFTLNSPQNQSPQRPGLRWDGGDIIAGLQVLRLIYDKPWALQIEMIDLSTWSYDGSITLVTNTPCRLRWGSAPGKEVGLEALANEKISRLDHLYREHGAIDRGRTTELDITQADRIAKIGP